MKNCQPKQIHLEEKAKRVYFLGKRKPVLVEI